MVLPVESYPAKMKSLIWRIANARKCGSSLSETLLVILRYSFNAKCMTDFEDELSGSCLYSSNFLSKLIPMCLSICRPFFQCINARTKSRWLKGLTAALGLCQLSWLSIPSAIGLYPICAFNDVSITVRPIIS